MHIIALTQLRIHPAAREYVTRRVAEGKTVREAMRALKRHLARVIYRILIRQATTRATLGPTRITDIDYGVPRTT